MAEANPPPPPQDPTNHVCPDFALEIWQFAKDALTAQDPNLNGEQAAVERWQEHQRQQEEERARNGPPLPPPRPPTPPGRPPSPGDNDSDNEKRSNKAQ
ncbi:hypothetical protein BDN72DRAFT_907361 [Pluteus cervinus]|uniref:Uncharacterized protein n=1 Tax=Pluteus cervinus TaxID=181527 RepID=A0ACD2ZWZ2_9AGAR|nr:hypothetical protein BDN72DRAFT_907361 [Pluteus cervinus]